MAVANKVLPLQSPVLSGDFTRPLHRRNDPRFLNQDQLGALPFLWDAAFLPSYDGASPVSNGALFKNMANDNVGSHAAAASMVVASGQTVNFVKGIDLSPATTSGSYLSLPSEFSASVYASPNHYCAIGLVLKLPSETEWNSASAQAPIYSHATANNGDLGSLGLVTLIMRTFGANKEIRVNRQLTWNGTTGTVENTLFINIPNGSPAFGKVCMLVYWRTAAGQRLTLYFINPVAFTASVAGRVMTVTTAPSGAALAIGSPIRGAGIPSGTVVAAFGSGSGGVGTYLLSRAVSAPLTDATLQLPVMQSLTATLAVGPKSTAAFFNTVPRVGLLNTQWSNAVLAAGAGNIRIHRVWMDACEMSGLDPAVIAAADWARVVARNEF